MLLTCLVFVDERADQFLQVVVVAGGGGARRRQRGGHVGARAAVAADCSCGSVGVDGVGRRLIADVRKRVMVAG